mmetsp:Transcript_2677/g.6255  ORF Transcript_2677/g.6255 Transcript_2677/m.6255 type:complete len:80 (+) Transcript_2677:533-772(+)
MATRMRNMRLKLNQRLGNHVSCDEGIDVRKGISVVMTTILMEVRPAEGPLLITSEEEKQGEADGTSAGEEAAWRIISIK